MAPGPVPVQAGSEGWYEGWQEGGEDPRSPLGRAQVEPHPPLPSGCPAFSRTSWSPVSCLLRWENPSVTRP